MEQFIAKTSKPLIIVLVVMITLFLFFGVGAFLVTLDNEGLMGSGWGSGISWMWIPALLFLTLSVLIGRGISSKKKDA